MNIPEPAITLAPLPFAHLPGVSYPAPRPPRKPYTRVAPMPAPPPAAPPAPMAGVTLRRSPLGYRYAYHPHHA